MGVDGRAKVKLDLLARKPRRDEEHGIKIKEARGGSGPARLGPRKSAAAPEHKLHAYSTPEAFAIDHGVQALPFAGTDPEGVTFRGLVHVPHPFASLCMKLTAALDYERTDLDKRDRRKEKHAFDVYLLTTMLDEAESDQIRDYATLFSSAPEMVPIRDAVNHLFGRPDGPGCRTITAQANKDRATELNLTDFCGLLGELFE